MNAAGTALKTVFPAYKDCVLDYGQEADFGRLWSFESLPSERTLIVWSRTAGDGDLWPIDASACLSPLDWAVAYAKHLGDQPWPEVLIIDAVPQSHEKTPSLAHFQTLRPDQLPWLTVRADPSIADIATWLAKSSRGKANDYETAALDRFLREVRLNLTEVRTEGDYDRHSISNIVAPMALLGATAKKTRHSKALLKLLTACGLCADGAGVSEDGEQGEGLQILLVDDQADHGWTQWLEKILPKAEIKAEPDANKLLDSLISQLEAAHGQKDLRFRLKLPGLENAANPVLFLDLRLFSGRFDAENAFFKRLLDVIERRFLNRDDLAWPSFDSTDETFIEATKAIKENWLEPESPAYQEALTWLPRIVALADMSLPIVLFSSTGRRDLIEPFKSYGNSITTFGKPRLSDLTTREYGRFLSPNQSRLHEAIATAREWLGTRPDLNRWITTWAASPTTASPQTVANQNSEYHAVLYIDETGNSPNLTFGGLIAIYNSADHEINVERELSRLYGASVRTANGKDWLRRNCALVYEQWETSLPFPPAFLQLSSDKSSLFQTSLEASDELHDETVGDNLWREILKRTLEASIYVIARRMAQSADIVSFSVRAPTRVKRPGSPGLQQALWERWGVSCDRVGPNSSTEDAIDILSRQWRERQAFGVWWEDFINLPLLLETLRPQTPSDERIRFFNYHDARPIAEEVMRLYRSSTYQPRADLVRAFGLNSHNKSQGKHVPIAHFLADALLDPGNRGVATHVIKDSYSYQLEIALETNRSLLWGLYSEAVASQLRASEPSAYAEVQKAVLTELVSVLKDDFSGVDLVELKNKRLDYLPTNAAPTVQIGKVFFKGQRHIRWVKTADGKSYYIYEDSRKTANLVVGDMVRFSLQRNPAPGRPHVARLV